MIGLFGGTFHPVHFGHINLAITLKEKCDLKEVWVIPAGCSPLREESLEPQHRLAMAELAFVEIEGFKVLNIEVDRFPSYTIDTVVELKKTFPEKQFALLLGEDAAHTFPLWKDAEKLLGHVKIKIGCRKGWVSQDVPRMDVVEEVLAQSRVETSFMEIDATTIRKRLKNKLYCGHLVPAKVLDYIYQNQLY